MEQTDEKKTMLQVMLDNIENDNIWNDSGSYKLDTCPFEEVFPAMSAYASLATTAKQSIIDGQKERIEELTEERDRFMDALQEIEKIVGFRVGSSKIANDVYILTHKTLNNKIITT